jgi:hypothetical protein
LITTGENKMMTKIKYGLSFLLGMTYISLLWYAVVVQDENIKGVVAYIFFIACVFVLTAIVIFLGENWKND